MKRKHLMWAGGAVAAVVVGALAIVGLTPAPPTEPSGPLKYVEIEHVYSGHKVKLDDGQELLYAGIRAPYPGDPGFEEALKRNKHLTEQEDVRLRFDKSEFNAKGQLVAYVYVPDGMVNELLVREGLAYVRLTPQTSRFAERLLAAQAEARADHLGLWRQRRPDRPSKYFADSKYGNFHRQGCEETPKIKSQRLVTYRTRHAAFDEGMAPCKTCRP